ncbi:MAG: hypothetical protein OHK0022_36930 [Roseiflexaceae bacterium]
MTNHVPAYTDQDALQQLEQRMLLANLVSNSLLFSLGRRYLDLSFEQSRFLQLLAADRPPAEQPHFLHLEQIGDLPADTLHQPFTALQTALSACHNPGLYTLLFLVVSDGLHNRLYLGVRSHQQQLYPVQDFVAGLGRFLQGNWPGTRFQSCGPGDPAFPDPLGEAFQRRLRSAVALTGVPSLKPGDRAGYPQSLDRLLRGLRGTPFVYMIVAEPVATPALDDMIHRARDLLGRVHSLTKMTLNHTTTLSRSQTQGVTNSLSESFATAHTVGITTTDDNRKNIAILAGAGLTAAAGMFPPVAFALALDGAPALISMLIPEQQRSSSTTQTRTTGTSLSIALTDGLSVSGAEALGREYLNAHSQATEEQLQAYIERFKRARTLGCWDVGVYLLADHPDVAIQGATQLRALLSGEHSDVEPIRIHDLTRVWPKARVQLQNFEQPGIALVKPEAVEGQRPLRANDRLDHPFGTIFSQLTTPLSTEELTLLVNLPQREVPGVVVMPTADFSLNAPKPEPGDLALGWLLEGGERTSLPYAISPRTLVKHALVTGITGSGKSTTCRSILADLGHAQIPFLVIEPAKAEYIEWALQHNRRLSVDSPDRINVFMPGVQRWKDQPLTDQLRLNPLDIVWLDAASPPQVLAHIDRLKSILNATFPMQEALPILLEEVLYTVYTRPHNWLADVTPPFGTPRPTLTLLLDQIRSVVAGKGYEDRVTANLTAALTTRVQSLRRGWKRDVFDSPQSIAWATIFDRPTVINLSQLGDDADKAFAMAVLLLFLYEYRQAQHEAGMVSTHIVQHVTVVEEAHRILSRAVSGSLEMANPQGKVAEMFSNVLSEIRAYGEGFLIVDQVPSRLVQDAIKNTNLKIVHRLVAEDDRQAMAGCMSLTTQQTAVINRLRPGQAIIYGDLDDSAALVQIHNQ